jgi:hypothetical protein
VKADASSNRKQSLLLSLHPELDLGNIRALHESARNGNYDLTAGRTCEFLDFSQDSLESLIGCFSRIRGKRFRLRCQLVEALATVVCLALGNGDVTSGDASNLFCERTQCVRDVSVRSHRRAFLPKESAGGPCGNAKAAVWCQHQREEGAYPAKICRMLKNILALVKMLNSGAKSLFG